MGPKIVGPGKVYFLKSTGNVGDAVDITEYIVGGDFNMDENDRPSHIKRVDVTNFVEYVLGVNPGLVTSVTIDRDEIEVELITLRIVD